MKTPLPLAGCHPQVSKSFEYDEWERKAGQVKPGDGKCQECKVVNFADSDAVPQLPGTQSIG